MAVKWNNIYRGGVHRTTAETREVAYEGDAETILPGYGVALDDTDGVTLTVGATDFFYVVGEQLYGNVDDNQVGSGSSLRLYSPRSGDLYAARAAAGVAVTDDAPLTINAAGLWEAAGENPVHGYIDNPSSAHPQTEPATTVAGQLIPIKIK